MKNAKGKFNWTDLMCYGMLTRVYVSETMGEYNEKRRQSVHQIYEPRLQGLPSMTVKSKAKMFVSVGPPKRLRQRGVR